MLATAGQMLPDAIMAVLRDAIPLGEIAISRNTAAGWRRYDQLPRPTNGLLLIGDALCNLNPLHGQGMTMAALQAVALRDCLQSGENDLPGRFHRAAADLIAPVWAMNAANDRRPSTGTRRTLSGRVRSWMQQATLTGRRQ